MDSVCEFIIKNYNTISFEYFDMEENNLDNIDEMLEYVISKLTSKISDISIINKFTEYNDTIHVKFLYKGTNGYISNTYNSRGYYYWVVHLGDVE